MLKRKSFILAPFFLTRIMFVCGGREGGIKLAQMRYRPASFNGADVR